ncbi:hypothetical protein [Streptomyces tauricus]|uniref:hypothetical protein n=1 Tax=Streptomyces tauricus TaxID=68274 RepID=UPI00224412F8|nr:hypothetical protein [Streptomyces tauricus]MCW8103449.1 hypothetical protein [Streptomyces tauricus]
MGQVEVWFAVISGRTAETAAVDALSRVELIAQLMSMAVGLVTADTRSGLAAALFALLAWELRRRPFSDELVCVTAVLLMLLIV